jgi:hypothetical protein
MIDSIAKRDYVVVQSGLLLIAPLVALVVAVAALLTWQQNRVISDFEEIDAMLLTDDLPIDAYLDRGFQTWLKTRATEE